MNEEACPLCHSLVEGCYVTDVKTKWTYGHCTNCDLVFRHARWHLNETDENSRYQLHENSTEDVHYINFIKTMTELLKPYLQKNWSGLDLGSGRAAPVEHILSADGFQVSSYDPLFFANPELLQKTYDYVIATEVIEHIARPVGFLDQVQKLTKPGGLVAFKSHWHTSQAHEFQNWYYRREDTHICFYSHKTLSWIATQWNWEILEKTGREVIFRTAF